MNNMGAIIALCMLLFTGCFDMTLVPNNDDGSPERVIVGNLLVDVYEVSIEEYCAVYPEYRNTLAERIQKANGDWWHPKSITKQPALLTYMEASEYAGKVGMRLPTYEEWAYIATSFAGINENNYFKRIASSCPKSGVPEIRRVNKGNFSDTMIGNAQEWAIGSDGNYVLMGIHHKSVCWGKIDYNDLIHPSRTAIGPNTKAGLRLVADLTGN